LSTFSFDRDKEGSPSARDSTTQSYSSSLLLRRVSRLAHCPPFQAASRPRSSGQPTTSWARTAPSHPKGGDSQTSILRPTSSGRTARSQSVRFTESNLDHVDAPAPHIGHLAPWPVLYGAVISSRIYCIIMPRITTSHAMINPSGPLDARIPRPRG
jgi:hypothetical protein